MSKLNANQVIGLLGVKKILYHSNKLALRLYNLPNVLFLLAQNLRKFVMQYVLALKYICYNYIEIGFPTGLPHKGYFAIYYQASLQGGLLFAKKYVQLQFFISFLFIYFFLFVWISEN